MTNELSTKLRQSLPSVKELQAPAGLSLPVQRDMYLKMNLIRCFDTKVKELWMNNVIRGLAHSYVGAEAIAVGACTALATSDYITSTHRGHGHAIAKGANIQRMMAELLGKYEGLNHGKGGSMHIADLDIGILGATGIVGSGMPIAVGSALASDRLGNRRVTVCFHGDGGTNQGVWHEALNMAGAWNLPCIFVIENNQMAIGTKLSWVSKETDLYRRAAGYGIPGVLADGFNVFDIYRVVCEAVSRARSGQGPTLIEARFLRLLGHFVADDQWYRDMDEVNQYWALDPIVRMREYFLAAKLLSAGELDEIDQEASRTIDAAVRYAREECTDPPVSTLYTDLYANGEIIQ
jgi:acetoin:2,6-dichlorophenolindophenol oxidoreductase subunit alpha